MRIGVAILVNAALLAVLLPWLQRQWQWAATRIWRTVLLVGLGLRVGVGLIQNWSIKDDAYYMSAVARMVTKALQANPAATWHTLTGAVIVFPSTGGDIVYQNTSNTWITIKLLVICSLGSLANDWLNALYLSLFAFVGCWQLVRVLATTFPGTPAGAGAVAFLLWPSVWYWSSGIGKEAILLGSGAWLTAQVLQTCYGPAAAGLVQARHWLGTVALAVLHFAMRYFFAAPLLGVLAGVALGQGLSRLGLARPRWAQISVLAVVLGLGAWLAPQVSVAFRLNKFTNQVMRIYAFNVAHSLERPHFEYPNLRPTIESFASHAPVAVANVLTRPWLGESERIKYVAAGFENALILMLLVLAMWAAWRGRAGKLPFGLALGLVVFCLILAFLIGITTPNLGTLNRYRSAMLPYLLLLLLQNDYAAAALRRLRRSVPTPAKITQP